MGWFGFAIVSFVAFGIQNYLYKVSAMRGLNTRAVTFAYVTMSTAVLWIVALVQPGPLVLTERILVLGALDALFYFLTTVTRIESLKFLPTSIAFPVARMSTLLVVLYAVVLLGEPFTWQLCAALALVFCVLIAVHSERGQDLQEWPQYGKGLALSGASLVTSAATNIISKLAAVNGSLTMYMVTANSLAVMLAFGEMCWTGKINRTDWTRSVFVVAALIAATNLLAWYSYLWALQGGPLGIVATVSSLAFIVPIVLSAIVHDERMSSRRWFAIATTAVTISLLHLAR